MFNGGRDFIFEDDNYLNFDTEEAENDNNPAFVFLAKIFDKEGARGLHLNNMDVRLVLTQIGNEYLQNIDIFKFNRTEEMDSFGFSQNGDLDFTKDEIFSEEVLTEIGTEMRKKRLLPSLTLFYGRSSSTYRQEIMRFLSYLYKERKRYQQIETQRDNGGQDIFMEVMADLNFEMDQDIQLPDLSQFSQVQASFGNIYAQESNLSFDQPIDTEIPRRQDSYLLQDIREDLLSANPVMEDFELPGGGNDFGSVQVKYEPNYDYEDYGNVEVNMQRNPEDFRTPTNLFQRAANRIKLVESNLKVYNMKKDLKQSEFRSNSEYFGPDSIAAKERMPRLKKIVDVKNNTARKEKVAKPSSNFDFTKDEDETFDEDFIKSIMGDRKRSRVRIAENDSLQAIEQKYIHPPEEIFTIESFNSLFTRNIKDFDLEKEMVTKDDHYDGFDGAAQSAYGDQKPRSSMDYEAGGGPENLDDYALDPGYAPAGQYFDGEDQDGELGFNRRESEPADMTGMNLLNNYFNIKEDDKIMSLERKLAQTSNFKITDFKKHVNEQYIFVLDRIKKVTLADPRTSSQRTSLGWKRRSSTETPSKAFCSAASPERS